MAAWSVSIRVCTYLRRDKRYQWMVMISRRRFKGCKKVAKQFSTVTNYVLTIALAHVSVVGVGTSVHTLHTHPLCLCLRSLDHTADIGLLKATGVHEGRGCGWKNNNQKRKVKEQSTSLEPWIQLDVNSAFILGPNNNTKNKYHQRE